LGSVSDALCIFPFKEFIVSELLVENCAVFADFNHAVCDGLDKLMVMMM
jgi:hypothetical protein